MNKPKYQLGDLTDKEAIEYANYLELAHQQILDLIEAIGLQKTLEVIANAVILHDEQMAEKLMEVIYDE